MPAGCVRALLFRLFTGRQNRKQQPGAGLRPVCRRVCPCWIAAQCRVSPPSHWPGSDHDWITSRSVSPARKRVAVGINGMSTWMTSPGAICSSSASDRTGRAAVERLVFRALGCPEPAAGDGAVGVPRDEARARKAGREIRAGLVWTNCWALLSEQFAEGGFKQSGYGYLCGPRAIEQFQNLKVYSQMAPPTA